MCPVYMLKYKGDAF